MKFHIKTYGCQMNERDSEALAGMLIRCGYTESDEESADVLLFNTCSVRDQAERKAAGKIMYMKKLKQKNPSLIIGALGCMAQRKGQALLDEIKHLDFVIGTGELHTLPEVIEKFRKERLRSVYTSEDKAVLTEMGTHNLKAGEVFGQIAITRGCNRFCSYCIVPYVRGREISREIGDVLKEAQMLVNSGVREIMLLGQNVAAYGLKGNVNPPPPDHSPFADLLYEMNQIDGLERIRFTSPYITYFNDKLIRTLAGCRKVCRNFHLPLQSGSNRILKAMNRQYTAESYLEYVERLRNAMPDMTCSTDVIVGFPGETGEDFNATRELMNKVGYDNAFIFKYSPRPGAKSALLEDSVPQEVKEERNALLLDDLARRVAAHLKEMNGQTVEVLVEGPSPRNAERFCGRTASNRMVHFVPDADCKPGTLRKVLINQVNAVSLVGKLL